MHFSVNASDINAGMSLVSHALTARPMRQIYDGVLIESAENGIFLRKAYPLCPPGCLENCCVN